MNNNDLLFTDLSPYLIICSKRVAKAIEHDPAYAGIPVQIKKWARKLYLIDKRNFTLELPKDWRLLKDITL